MALFLFQGAYLSLISLTLSVNKLIDFRKFLVTILLAKLAQILGDWLGNFENISFKQKLFGWVGNFWANFGKIWATLYCNIWSHCSPCRTEIPDSSRPFCFLKIIVYFKT